MIASMTKYSFILLNGTQGDLLERLQQIGLVDITRSAKPLDATSEELVACVPEAAGICRVTAEQIFNLDNYFYILLWGK